MTLAAEVQLEADLVTDQAWEGERDGGVGDDFESEACMEMQAIIQLEAGCPSLGRGWVKEFVVAETGGEKPWQPQRHTIDLSQWGTLQSKDWACGK